MGPNKRRKRQSGRPKVKRTRFRSKFDKPEDSNITCQICTENGHNARTCPNKQAIEATAVRARQENLDPATVAAAPDPGFRTNIM